MEEQRVSAEVEAYASSVSSLRIRAASVSDAEGIACVHVRAWRAAYAGLLPDAVIGAHARKRHAF